MEFKQQLIFLFSSLGGMNGLLLSGYFLLKRGEKRYSDFFLGGLILMLSIRIIKSAFLYFNPYLLEPFVQVGLTACFLIGPFLLLYTMTMTQRVNQAVHQWAFQIFPFILAMGVLGYFFPYYEYRNLWSNYLVDLVIYKQWLIYILISGYLLKSIFTKIRHRVKLEDHEFWLVNIFVGTTLVYVAFETSNYTSYIAGAMSFTFLLYTNLLLFVYWKKKKSYTGDLPIKYGSSTLTETQVKEYGSRLNQFVSREKPYLDSDLALIKLSKLVGITGKELSQVINQSLNQNYSQYIAQLRTDEAKRLLRDKNYHHLKIEAIAYESGFNSVSAFNQHFKSNVGMTAKEYRSEIINKSSLPES